MTVTGDRPHQVVVIAGGIEDELLGLGLADAVRGLGNDGIRAGFRWREEVSPLAEGEAAKIVAQRRIAPTLAAIDRYLNTSDAVSAIGIVMETGQVSTRGRASL